MVRHDHPPLGVSHAATPQDLDMKRNFSLLIIVLSLTGAGCIADTSVNELEEDVDVIQQVRVVLPTDDYLARRTFKAFGEQIADRFSGYHVGDDIEFADVADEVPVYAIADGVVVQMREVSGYGGFALIDHGDVNAIYGHIDLGASTLAPGDQVTKGQVIARLGDGETAETDGERKHLHFGLYTGGSTRINGYESTEAAVKNWINPQDYFTSQGLMMDAEPRRFTSADLGSEVFQIEFTIPRNMEVEYIHSLKALNIFTLDGEGSARERSAFLIRYFDASEFLTLSTVEVLETTDMTVGQESYTAKRYVIEKKFSVADFAEQPSWRNRQHVVTDFRASDGFTRYYVVAANPEVDASIYEEVLASMKIVE